MYPNSECGLSLSAKTQFPLNKCSVSSCIYLKVVATGKKTRKLAHTTLNVYKHLHLLSQVIVIDMSHSYNHHKFGQRFPFFCVKIVRFNCRTILTKYLEVATCNRGHLTSTSSVKNTIFIEKLNLCRTWRWFFLFLIKPPLRQILKEITASNPKSAYFKKYFSCFMAL